jgi:hypothetical protein
MFLNPTPSNLLGIPTLQVSTESYTHLAPGFATKYPFGFVEVDRHSRFLLFLPSRRCPGAKIVYIGAYDTYAHAHSARNEFLFSVCTHSTPIRLGALCGMYIWYDATGRRYEHTSWCACCYCTTTARVHSARIQWFMRFTDSVPCAGSSLCDLSRINANPFETDASTTSQNHLRFEWSCTTDATTVLCTPHEAAASIGP